MGNEWTPGPWKFDRSKAPTDGEYDYGIGADGHVIAETFGRVAEDVRPNAKANAQLISAAPEMAAELQRWIAPYDGWDRNQLARRADPATINRVQQTRALLSRIKGTDNATG